MKNIPKKLVAALVVTCTVIAGAAIGLPSNASAADKVYNIALSNSYIGNQWRVQMVNLTKAYADKDKTEHPYDDVSAMIAIASTALYWIHEFTEGEELGQAFISVQSKVQTLIDKAQNQDIFEVGINKDRPASGRLN